MSRIRAKGLAWYLNKISLIVLLGSGTALALRWPGIPDILPAHYDAYGAADRYGGKWELWIVYIIGVFIYTMLTLIVKAGVGRDNTFTIREVNKPSAYRAYELFMSVEKLFLLLSFTYMNEMSIHGLGLGRWFLPVMIGGALIPVVAYVKRLSGLRE